MRKKKNRKTIQIQNPILRNCLYIIVPVVLIVGLKFIGVGASWLYDVLSKAGWPILITFVVTSLFWACFYGVREQKLLDGEEAPADDDEEDEDESGGF